MPPGWAMGLNILLSALVPPLEVSRVIERNKEPPVREPEPGLAEGACAQEVGPATGIPERLCPQPALCKWSLFWKRADFLSIVLPLMLGSSLPPPTGRAP